MVKLKVPVPTLKCRRCGHAWVPRQTTITICPRCKSRLWQTPRKPKKRDGA